MPKRTYTDDQLETAIASSENWMQAFLLIGISVGSQSSMTRTRKYAVELGIDCSHLSNGNGSSKLGWRKHKPDSIFRKGVPFNTSIRRYFTESVEYKCANPECGLNEWLGQPITLQVDHIDGDRTNNTRENLRLLCPNCRSQTETWGVPKAYRD